MSSYVMLCHGILLFHCVMLYDGMLNDLMLCYAVYVVIFMLYYIRYVTLLLCYVMFTLSYLVLFYVMLCYLCYVNSAQLLMIMTSRGFSSWSLLWR